jgi:hypothetical protein
LRLQRYEPEAKNSLKLIENDFITKTWLSKFIQVARLMAYQETSNWNQNFNLTCRLISLKFSGSVTFHIYFISPKRYFFEKGTLRLSCRYATFARLRSPTSEAEILVLISCFLIGHMSGYLQEFRKPSFCYENIFYEPEAVFRLKLISLQPQL